MKRLLFGNEYADHVVFCLGDISVKENVIEVNAALRAGFFAAELPLLLEPDHCRSFVKEVDQVYETLSGSASLHSEGPSNVVDLVLKAKTLGHIQCQGKAEINRNSLSFSFDTDQTALTGLSMWFKGVIMRFEGLREAPPA